MSSWYLTKLVFRIETHTSTTAQFDEQWRLVRATDYNEARKKAAVLGEAHQDEGAPSPRTTSRWRFIQVAELFEFGDELRDGSELFSRIAEPESEKEYLNALSALSQHLQQRIQPMTYTPT